MEKPAVGLWREPILPGLVTTREQMAWARRRPRSARTDPPGVGEIVGLRLAANGPVVRARVLRVDLDPPADTRPGAEIDWNVWRYVVRDPTIGPIPLDAAGNRAVELVNDPWWNVVLVTLDGPALRTETRESRLPGSPGWLRAKE